MALSLWTLGDIKTKVRNLSGRIDTNDLTDADLLSYINRYYQTIFPLEIRPKELQTYFQFNTTADVDEYDLSSQTDAVTGNIFEDGYMTLETPVTIAGYDMNYYQDPGQFYAKWPETTTYSSSRSTDVLHYEQTILLRTPPDDTYRIKFISWLRPAAFVNDSDVPRMEEWGPVIAYGTAIQIAEDTGDLETVGKITALYENHKNLVMRKAHWQNVSQRAMPKF